VFTSLSGGVARAERLDPDGIIARDVGCVEGLADGLVVAGLSLGVLPAQKLAQTNSGIGGAFRDAALPLTAFGSAWSSGVALQIQLTEEDEWGLALLEERSSQ
jgi:hypothetical protein